MSQNYHYPANVSVIPAGGATSANQVLEIAQLTAIDAKVLTDTQLRATPVPVSGTVTTGGLTDAQLRASPVPVSLTSTTITGTVAVTQSGTWNINDITGTVSLPTGAATESTLNTLNGKVTAVNTGAVTISTALPAGANVIGHIIVDSGTVTTGGLTDTQLRATPVPVSLTSTTITGTVAATQSGTWNITNVSGTVSLPTGASTESTLSTMNAKVPALGQALAASSVPVVLTALQLTALTPPTTVTAKAGTPTAGTVTQAAITVGTAAVRATVSGSAPASTRSVLTITPDSASTAKFYIGSSGVTTTSTTRGQPLAAGATFVANSDAGDYYIISDTASQTVYIMEQA